MAPVPVRVLSTLRGGPPRAARPPSLRPLARALALPALLAAFAVPAPGAAAGSAPPAAAAAARDFGFASGLRSESVPFRTVDGRPIVDVRLDGHGPYRFIFDTGASANLVSPEVARALGLRVTARGEESGTGEKSLPTGAATVGVVELGRLRLLAQPFLVLSMEDMPPVFGAERVDGVIGQSVLTRVVTTVDYEFERLVFTERAAFRAPRVAAAVPFRAGGPLPEVAASLDGVAGWFGLDTGARSSLLLLSAFVEGHHLRERYEPRLEGITGWGLGGPIRSQLARARQFDLGPYRIERPLVRLSLQRSGMLATGSTAGLVGPDILGQFTLTFDYADTTVYLQKNSRFGLPITYDRSGMWIVPDSAGFQALDVIPGGPADQAGVRKGDVLEGVDGKPAKNLLLPDVRDSLRRSPVGTRVRLRIRRQDAPLELTLVLRDLV